MQFFTVHNHSFLSIGGGDMLVNFKVQSVFLYILCFKYGVDEVLKFHLL